MRLVLVSLLSLFALVFAGPALAGPVVGDKAPAFQLPGSDGEEHSLTQDEGGVVLAWFPKAFTPG